MQFETQAEELSAFLLIPIFSISLFLIISFLEIFDKHGEILFMQKTHKYKNRIFITPLIIAILVGVFLYGFYWHGDVLKVTETPPPQPCTEHAGNLTKLRECRDDFMKKDLFSLIDKWLKSKP